MIEVALGRARLASYFDHIFCYTELGYRKDQPEFWLEVQRTLGVPLKHIAMVGDSYEQDAAFPRQFGVQGVWFNPSVAPAQTPAGVPVVSDLLSFSRWAVASAA
jgi:FMN phosphatase YigB (HAD superfamily)